MQQDIKGRAIAFILGAVVALILQWASGPGSYAECMMEQAPETRAGYAAADLGCDEIFAQD